MTVTQGKKEHFCVCLELKYKGQAPSTEATVDLDDGSSSGTNNKRK